MTSVLILSQMVKIKIKVQMSNSHRLWLYFSDVSPIVKSWKEIEEEIDKDKCEN